MALLLSACGIASSDKGLCRSAVTRSFSDSGPGKTLAFTAIDRPRYLQLITRWAKAERSGRGQSDAAIAALLDRDVLSALPADSRFYEARAKVGRDAANAIAVTSACVVAKPAAPAGGRADCECQAIP